MTATAAPEGSRPSLLLNIQFLRFVAATMVVLLHGSQYYESMGGTSALFTAPRHIGFAGVDIFFVISGFIIWTTNAHTRGARPIFQYLYRRLTRIYLGYWPFFLFIWLVRAWWWPERMEGVRLVASFFLIPQRQAGQLLHVAWTLSYELYFYGLFFLLLFSARRVLLLTLATAVVVLVNLYNYFVLGAFEPGSYQNITGPMRFLSSPVLLEFFMGCFLAHAISRGYRRYATSAFLLGLGLLLFGAVLTYRGIILGPLLNQAVYGGGAMGVIYGLVCAEIRGFAPFPRFSSLMGGASYSIYLSHTILYRVAAGLGLYPAVRASAVPAGLAYVLLVAAILAFSAAFYVWVERPLYRAAKALFPSRRRPKAVVESAVVDAGVLAPPAVEQEPDRSG